MNKYITRSKLGLFVASLAIYAFMIEPYWVQMTYHHILLSGKHHKLRIVQLSDLHLRNVGRREQLVINEVSRLNPDLVILSGDVIDKADSISILESFLNAFGDGQKLAILGNWEHWANVDIMALRRVYESHRTTLLINQVARYNLQGRQLEVIGLDAIRLEVLLLFHHHFLLIKMALTSLSNTLLECLPIANK